MNLFSLKKSFSQVFGRLFLRRLLSCSLCIIALSFVMSFCFASPAIAALDDDRYDGNIYMIYAGNGSLVPPKVTLADSLKKHKPAIVVFYADDSRDSKQYALVVSRLQEFYGRAATIIPIAIDSLGLKTQYKPTEAGYYYSGVVPQTVILDGEGNVVFNEKGQIPYEKMDDVLREVFDLLPRSESAELRRRIVNEINAELSE
ncbi:MAG: thylakoid membrane photosystem I accumulation factor [Cyanobacteriota bacterium]|nr:thylakoid membrane photosystem I accumulation factor [Cyanobacteriota bacterium]